MRRLAAAVILAAGLALATSGCGIQPTGVNTSKTEPFSVAESSKSPSPEPSETLYPVQLVLYPSGSNYAREFTCYLPKVPKAATDLVPMLANANEAQCGVEVSTYVPQDLRLQKTDNAHEYRVANPSFLHPFALQQLECTFDRYWIDHPDGRDPSTRFILPDGPLNWQDCLYLLGDSVSTKTGDKSTAVPSMLGN